MQREAGPRVVGIAFAHVWAPPEALALEEADDRRLAPRRRPRGVLGRGWWKWSS